MFASWRKYLSLDKNVFCVHRTVQHKEHKNMEKLEQKSKFILDNEDNLLNYLRAPPPSIFVYYHQFKKKISTN